MKLAIISKNKHAQMLITVVLVLRKKKKTALVRVILYRVFFIVQKVIVRSLFVTEPRECGTMQDYW